MNDIKSIVSVIKILERTIGILENCNDVGEISDITRKRVIEMLNKATLEIYFWSNNSFDEKTSKTCIPPEEETVIATSVSKPVENIAVEETYEIQPVEETVVKESVPDEIVEEEIDSISEEEFLPEEEFLTEEEFLPEEEFVEEENIIENVPEENTVSEDDIFSRQDILSDKPLFEWEIDKSEPVQNTREDDINLLKLQLEEERKRLEQELQNWQDERRKRDEEILATKKLLESLQQQAAINQAKQQPAAKPPVIQPPVAHQPQAAKPVRTEANSNERTKETAQQPPQPAAKPVQSSRQVQVQQPQPPQQPAKTEPLIRREPPKEPAKKEETQEALIDRFIGTKKVLHENFETDNMVNKISTPVASLPRAIGINDKFRFIKELFGGDSDVYNETIKRLDTIGSLVSAISYIESNFSWDKNSDSVKQLISLIRRRYM